MKLEILEIEAYSKKEAGEKVAALNVGLEVKFDATRSYNEAILEADFEIEEFAKAKLNKTVKGASGIGFVVALEPGQPETRTRLYEVENNITVGTVKYALDYMLIGEKSKVVYGIEEDKSAALKKAKELMSDAKENIQILKAKLPVEEGDRVTALVKFNPSESTKLGKYLVFGYTD